MFMGGGLFITACAGKGAIRFYRAVKTGKAFAQPTIVGQYYSGGFEKEMTKREAALILGVRYGLSSFNHFTLLERRQTRKKY